MHSNPTNRHCRGHSPLARRLIPVNYTAYVPAVKTEVYNGTSGVTANTSTSINDEFLRMTMSAVPFGSNVLL